MAYPKRLTYDTIRALGFAAISGTFAAIGGALAQPPRLIKIINDTDRDLEVSIDGTLVHDYVPVNAFTLYDLTANAVRDEGAFFREGITFFIRRLAAATNPTAGNAYIVVIRGHE